MDNDLFLGFFLSLCRLLSSLLLGFSFLPGLLFGLFLGLLLRLCGFFSSLCRLLSSLVLLADVEAFDVALVGGVGERNASRDVDGT